MTSYFSTFCGELGQIPNRGVAFQYNSNVIK
jgi:hypothetical protein